jgi:hypothetical protein
VKTGLERASCVKTDLKLSVLGYLGDTLGAIIDRKRPSLVYTKRALEECSDSRTNDGSFTGLVLVASSQRNIDYLANLLLIDQISTPLSTMCAASSFPDSKSAYQANPPPQLAGTVITSLPWGVASIVSDECASLGENGSQLWDEMPCISKNYRQSTATLNDTLT